MTLIHQGLRLLWLLSGKKICLLTQETQVWSLEEEMDMERGTWRVIVHGVTKESDTTKQQSETKLTWGWVQIFVKNPRLREWMGAEIWVVTLLPKPWFPLWSVYAQRNVCSIQFIQKYAYGPCGCPFSALLIAVTFKENGNGNKFFSEVFQWGLLWQPQLQLWSSNTGSEIPRNL